MTTRRPSKRKSKVEINEERERERKIIQNKTCVQNKRKHKEVRTKPKKIIQRFFLFEFFFLYKEKERERENKTDLRYHHSPIAQARTIIFQKQTEREREKSTRHDHIRLL